MLLLVHLFNTAEYTAYLVPVKQFLLYFEVCRLERFLIASAVLSKVLAVFFSFVMCLSYSQGGVHYPDCLPYTLLIALCILSI